MDFINRVINSDCVEALKQMPDGIANTCVTSPPYFGLRDYGHDGQIGLEETPEQYVAKLVDVFREVRRVLRDDGTLWLNLGDSYNGSGKAVNNPEYQQRHTAFGKQLESGYHGKPVKITGLKPKDLIGIPWKVAFALQADGWYLRQDIIWHKPNPMPESVTDRCTKAHEYIFLLSKSPKYYYDAEAIKVDAKDPEDDMRRIMQQHADNKSNPDQLRNGLRGRGGKSAFRGQGHFRDGEGPANRKGRDMKDIGIGGKANKRSVWTVTTKPFKDAHFATFPEELIVDCIKAGCPEGGLVIDPFGGAGTTAIVAKKLNRNYCITELNPAYVQITEKRIRNNFGLFA